MKQYSLHVIVHQPSEETENKYMAEVPLLPGCRAWGDTPGETLDYLRDVVNNYIRSSREHGDPLPGEIEEAA
ncbi:MAG: type II toxin-antitoxin system HicB family antitoxin [Dehalococcoidaceae bacterium]|nr:type II toxin-antitoxin system HicB family antitoxin [Dehalococcoidaceae bacterium]